MYKQDRTKDPTFMERFIRVYYLLNGLRILFAHKIYNRIVFPFPYIRKHGLRL